MSKAPMTSFSSSLAEARRRSDQLFSLLAPEAWLTRPVAERHRLLFYLGHLEAFDWNLLVKAPPRHAHFERLFAFGIDPLDALPRDVEGDWPPLPEVRDWVQQARRDVDLRGEPPRLEGLIALEHRLMHLETLSYLFEELPAPLWRPPAPRPDDAPAPAQRWLDIAAGPVQLGLERATDAGRGWCNEYDGHTAHVAAFQVAARKTTNADWLEFVEAGGYHARRWWSDEGWRWREAQALEAPLRWRRADDGWRLRVLGVEVPLPPGWPVFVSHAEASAFARWQGARLPTEPEWHRAVHGTPSGETREYPWGAAAPQPGVHGNFGFAAPHPTRVGAHPAGASAFGLDEPVGNGWEWTSSPFAPFAGFERYAVYPGYSADFFDGRHFVLAGGAHVTATPLLRRSFRNWFQPHYRAVFATLRLARDAS